LPVLFSTVLSDYTSNNSKLATITSLLKRPWLFSWCISKIVKCINYTQWVKTWH